MSNKAPIIYVRLSVVTCYCQHKAIRENNSNVEEMKQHIWTTYFHNISINDNLQHLCPSDSWCKYNYRDRSLNFTHHHHVSVDVFKQEISFHQAAHLCEIYDVDPNYKIKVPLPRKRNCLPCLFYGLEFKLES